jgi:hypothetical protein
MPVEQSLGFGLLYRFQLFLRLGAAKFHGVFICLHAFCGAGFLFAKLVEIYGIAHGVSSYRVCDGWQVV